MNNQQLKKLSELLSASLNEVAPKYARGEEVADLWELDATGELYRYLEGLAS